MKLDVLDDRVLCVPSFVGKREVNRAQLRRSPLRVSQIGKPPAVDMAAIRVDGDKPFLAHGVKGDVTQVLSPMASKVLSVLHPTSDSEVLPPVIQPVPVDVVDFCVRGRIREEPVHRKVISGSARIHTDPGLRHVPPMSDCQSNVSDVDACSRALVTRHTDEDNPCGRSVRVQFNPIRCSGGADGPENTVLRQLAPVGATQSVFVRGSIAASSEKAWFHSEGIVL